MKQTSRNTKADAIGWLGSTMFAVCGAPQAWLCFQEGNGQGLSPWFIGLWIGGEVCYVISVKMKFGWVPWMMLNYFVNIFFASVIAYYLLFPR